jgi:hypothetical protein
MTVSSSRPAARLTPRAGVVTAGRRRRHATTTAIDRPRLDDAEHGVMLNPGGTTTI